MFQLLYYQNRVNMNLLLTDREPISFVLPATGIGIGLWSGSVTLLARSHDDEH
jgi:hypothetical protein